jgi:hypothetical protein
VITVESWNSLIRRRVAIAFAAAIVALIVAAPSAAARAGAVEGRVVNATTGERLSGIDVTLHLSSNQAEIGTATTTSGSNGRFSFPAPASGVTTFSISATYDGNEYWTQDFSALDPPTDVPVRVFEPTTEPKDVSVASWVVWIDREGTGAAVQHSLRWANEGTRAYVGSGADAEGAVVVQVPLAAGASNFQFLDLFLRSPGRVQGSSFVDDAPLPPGASAGTIRYTTPELSTLDLPVTLPTKSLRVLIPQNVDVRSTELTPSGQTTQQGVTYAIYAATDLAAGDRLRLSLSGLTAARGTRGGPSTTLVILVGSAIVVAMGIVVVWRLGRAGRQVRRPAPVRRSASRVGRGGGRERPVPAGAGRRPRAASGANGRRRAEPPEDDDVELLIDEIAALDLSFERGLLDESSYRALRAAAKRRLLRSRETAGHGGAR